MGKTNLYENGPALLPVDNDVGEAGGYKAVDAPACPDQGVVVHNVVPNWGSQHLNFKNEDDIDRLDSQLFASLPQGCRLVQLSSICEPLPRALPPAATITKKLIQNECW